MPRPLISGRRPLVFACWIAALKCKGQAITRRGDLTFAAGGEQG